MKTDTAIKNQWALSSLGYIREYDTHKAICEMKLIDKDRWSDTNPQWAQNAELIVAAVNACKEINPDNPLNVAKAIPEMLKMLKHFEACLTGETPMPRSVLLNHVVKTINQIIQKQ